MTSWKERPGAQEYCVPSTDSTPLLPAFVAVLNFPRYYGVVPSEVPDIGARCLMTGAQACSGGNDGQVRIPMHLEATMLCQFKDLWLSIKALCTRG